MSEVIDGGLTFSGTLQPPDVPADPTGEGWRGPQGEQGEQGDTGATGPGGEATGNVTATGSTRARTLADRAADVINLLDYVDPNPAVDATANIQAAITAARYKTLIVPARQYIVSSTITGLGPIIIAGMGHGGGPGEVSEPGTGVNVSEFICATAFTSGDMFNFPSEYPVNVRDIQFSAHVSLSFTTLTSRGSGAALHLVGQNTTGGTNACSSIERVAFSGFDVDIYLERCADANITQCYFQAWKTAAIDVGTGGYAVESSPGHIHHNKFFGDVTAGTAQLCGIRTSSGYGGITNNLFVGSQTGILVNANDLVNIGSMMIAFNSIEEQLSYGINIVQSGSTTIDAITIQNNEFSNLTNGAVTAHVNVIGAANASIKTLSITGNKIQSFLTGGAGVCISVQTCTTGVISENLFNISGCYAISVGSVVSVDVLDNKIAGTGILGTGGYLFGDPVKVVLRDTSTRAIAAASTPNMADGSSLYISDGKAVANGSTSFTSGGTGCIIWRIGSAWVTIPSAVTAIDNLPIGQTTQAAGGFSSIFINGTAAANRQLNFLTSGSTRWTWQAVGGTEPGANAGSNMALTAYSDAGAFLYSPLSASRSTGLITLSKGAAISGGSSTIDGAVIGATTPASAKVTTFGANSATPSAKITITGSRGSATATVLASLLTAMATFGLITDSTTA